MCSQFVYNKPPRRNSLLHGTTAIPAGTRFSIFANRVHVRRVKSSETASKTKFSFRYSNRENSRLRRRFRSGNMQFKLCGETDTVPGFIRSSICEACVNANSARFLYHRIFIDVIIGTSQSPNSYWFTSHRSYDGKIFFRDHTRLRVPGSCIDEPVRRTD